MSAFGEIWHQLRSSGWIVLASFVIGYLAWSARVAWRENKKLCPRCGCSLVGIWFEERDLIASYGVRYRNYRERVPMLFPRISRGSDGKPSTKTT